MSKTHSELEQMAADRRAELLVEVKSLEQAFPRIAGSGRPSETKPRKTRAGWSPERRARMAQVVAARRAERNGTAAAQGETQVQ